MYNDTITLFNRYKSSSGDIWYPTVIHNVNLIVDKSSLIAKYGAESKDNASLNIRYSGDCIVEEKKWMPPKEWRKQHSEKTLTFSDGQSFDFFYVGEWEDITPIADDDYQDGFYDYMNSNYDYVFVISSVAKYSVIPHFEILAR